MPFFSGNKKRRGQQEKDAEEEFQRGIKSGQKGTSSLFILCVSVSRVLDEISTRIFVPYKALLSGVLRLTICDTRPVRFDVPGIFIRLACTCADRHHEEFHASSSLPYKRRHVKQILKRRRMYV